MLTVRQAMTPDPQVIPPDATAVEAAQLMQECNTGSLLVGAGEQEKLQGFLTDRDIAIRCVAAEHDPQACTVSDIMNPKVMYCLQDDDLASCAQNMQQNQVTRLAVLDQNKRLVGIVSHGDIAKCMLEHGESGQLQQHVNQLAAQQKAA